MVFIKKRSFFILPVIIAVFILPITLFAQDVIAYLGEVGGEVYVIKSNPDKEVKAEPGMLLGSGDTVKTGDESYVSIIFQDDGSRVKLAENAVLTLNATRKKEKLSKKMFLGAGKMFAKITKKRGTDVQIKTPTSVASVKGTRFILEELDWGETWLWVLEDAVELSNEKGSVTVNEGQKGKATKDKLDVETIDDTDVPVEPGEHEMIFFFDRSDGSGLQRELRIEFEN